MHQKKNSTQQSSAAVKTNNYGQTVLTEKNILNLIYEDKWNTIKECVVPDEKFVNQYNKQIRENKDRFNSLNINNDEIGQDLFDQNNRISWYMPDEYKNFDIEDYVLGLCNTAEEKARVEQELDLFKSHAMVDVLCFLKYLVDTMRKKNIVWGVGRGSSVASYILYLLGVHKVDSIKYNLDPKEFLR